MKILKIEFRNINSLRGNHIIDFTQEPFRSNALFAITGPTGSGKSTILDVITLALFNQVPRIGKITRSEIINKGAILTRNQLDAFAKVTYACKSGIFISSWSISTNRNGNLREYDMQLGEADSDVLIDLKKSEVPTKNEALIGLSYDQFIKAVLLAQGDFALFLKAKKDERGDLLEKITGTGIYRELGRLAFEKFRDENKEIKTQQETIAIKKSELLNDDLLEENQNALADGEKKIPIFEVDITKIQECLNLKETIAKQQMEITTVNNNYVEALKTLKNFENEKGEILKNHENAQPLAEDINQWVLLQERGNEIVEEQKNNSSILEKLIAGKNGLKEQIFTFLDEKTADSEIIETLSSFAEKVNKLLQRRQEKRSAHQNLNLMLTSALKDVPVSIGNDINANRTALRNLSESSLSTIETLKLELVDVNLNQLEVERKRLKEGQKRLIIAINLKEKIDSLHTIIDQRENEQQKISAQLEHLPRDIKQADTMLELKRETLEKLNLIQENQRLHASLNEHRTRLKEGESCPLCGAIEHPWASAGPQRENDLLKKISEIKTEFEHWNRKKIALTTTLELVQAAKTKLDQSEKEEKAEFQKIRQSLDLHFEALSLEKDIDLDQISRNYEHKLDALEVFEKESSVYKSIQEAFPLIDQLVILIKEGKALSETITGLYSGTDIYKDTQALQQRWITIEENEKNSLQKEKELVGKKENISTQAEKLKSELEPKIKQLGYTDIFIIKNAILPHDTYSELRKNREKLKSTIANYETTLKTLNHQLEISKGKDQATDFETLKANLNTLKKELQEVRQRCEGFKRQIRNHEERLQDIQNIQFKIGQKEKEIMRWRILNELIGDANGKKFNEYAQNITLSLLLRLANTRLKDLSDRYRMDTPKDDEDDSLIAIDEHMGGQRRSVKTLSGGETFILSLSMALALSDLASRNVEINSLFIDEGFGTLDPETLDQTLDTLERLQASSSKTIGIISHVDSLKERISTQIQVKRNGQGYSSLYIR